MRIGEPRFILTAFTGTAIADLICCSDGMDYEFFSSELRKRAIGFQIITQDDAIKLLVAKEVIAYGCYLAMDDGRDNIRAIAAKSLYLGLSRQFGVVRTADPIALRTSMLPENPSVSLPVRH
jgi:hypothetical protein